MKRNPANGATGSPQDAGNGDVETAKRFVKYVKLIDPELLTGGKVVFLQIVNIKLGIL